MDYPRNQASVSKLLAKLDAAFDADAGMPVLKPTALD
jgi:hypothetical protein